MSAVRGPTALPNGAWIVSRLIEVESEALSVFGFGGIGTSLPGGKTT
jgi:hypothetical protein